MYSAGMKHAPSVIIVSRQRSERGIISLVYETCSISFHRLKTTNRACLFTPKTCNILCQLSSSHDIGQSMVIPPQVWNMLRQLSSSHDNGQSVVIYLSGMEHAPWVVIVSWQRSEHGNIYLMHETCSVSWHRLMTTVRAWLFIPKVWICSVSYHRLLTTFRPW